MRKGHTRVHLVGLALQFYPTPSVFSWKVGHMVCGQLCALEVMRQSSSLLLYTAIYILHCNQRCTLIREIFIGKIFSWGKPTTKIKCTKFLYNEKINCNDEYLRSVAGTPSRV